MLLSLGNARAHVPHDIIYSLDVSPTFSEDGLLFASSTQFGEAHLMSSNYGETFSESHAGMRRTLVTGHTFSPDYAGDGTIFMVTKAGYYKSTDRGLNWQKQKLFADEEVLSICTATDFVETETIFVLDIATGLYRSVDAGRSWSRVEEVDTAKVVGQPVLYRKLGVSPEFGDDGLMFLFSVPRRILGVAEKHVWKFNDRTKELKKIAIGRDNNYINGFAFSPKGSKKKLVFAATAQGPFVSKDAGDSWKQLSTNGAQKLFISPDFERDGLIYLMNNKGGLQVSTDSGQSFTPTDLNLDGRYIDNLTFSPTYAGDQTLFVTTFGEGVFRSQNAGQTWDYFGLKGKLLFSGPTFSTHYATDRTIFAPAVDGIYRSTDDGKTWSNVLNRTQFLAKVPFLTLKDPTGHEIPLVFGGPEEMRRYGLYDEEIGEPMFRKSRGAFQKIEHPKAYLASYYRFNVEEGSAVEICFYGTGVEFKCVQGNDLGIVNIVLDGQPQGEFDLYNERRAFDVTGFVRDDLPEGFHKLRVIATGRKNDKSTGFAMTFNAANIKN